MRARLIGVDWGTTRLRACLIGDGGRVIDARETDEGLRALGPGLFEPALARAAAGGRAAHGAVPTLCAGGVGARSGWLEALSVACPADAATLAQGLVSLDTQTLGRVHVLPGVRQADDVMRGEETQIFGALAMDCGDGLYVLPGTHSKWARVERQRIARFSTMMTGDVFAALKDHTILAASMGEAASDAGFARGLAMARELDGAGDLLTKLFGLRVAALDGVLSPEDSAGALSGLLIGAEFAAMARGADRIVLIAGDALAARYEEAAACFGVSATRAPPHCAAQGQFVLAYAAGLVENRDHD